MTIELGTKVCDTLSGLVGIAVARTTYLYATAKILVDPCLLENGKVIEGAWVDEARLHPSGDDAKVGFIIGEVGK